MGRVESPVCIFEQSYARWSPNVRYGRADEGASVFDNRMTGYGCEPTPKWLTDDACERRFVAGPRPIAARPGCSHFGLFSHLERVVDLNAEIPDRTLQFCMAEQELYRPKVLCTAVN
jgi:hypothetical protein